MRLSTNGLLGRTATTRLSSSALETLALWRKTARGNKVAKNGGYSLLGYVMPVAATLVATPLLVHRLGVNGYGLWILATSFLGLVGVADLGLSTAAAKYVAQHHAQGNARAASAAATTGALLYLAIGLVLSAPLFFLAPEIAALFDSRGASAVSVAGVIRVASIGVLPMFLVNAGMAVPIGLQDFRTSTIVSTMQPVLNLGLCVTVAYSGGSVTDVVGATVVSVWATSVTSLVLGYRLLRRLGGQLATSAKQLREISSFIAFSSATGVGNVLFAFVDRLVVAAALGVSAVAYYSVATGVAINLLRVAGAVTKPLMPASSSWASASNTRALKRWLLHSTAAVGCFEVIAAGFLLALSRPLMTVWLGSSVGTHALSSFRILVLVFAIAAIGAPAFQITNGIGAPWVPAVAGVAGGALTVLLIFVLSPPWGVAGAAAANLGGWTALFPLAYLLRKFRGPRLAPVKGWAAS
jgi:O-antigen/teichoic acid export membrane protein